jgi:SWI/SNF-related matrix-associated actin-dependent regulator 1 of chromatin subfamily A
VRLRSDRRLLLSGTPVQNNLQELLALMSFCMPKVFDSSSEALADYFRTKGPRETERVRELLEPFVLRRLKADVLGQLAPKEEKLMAEPMHAVQRAVYEGVLRRWKETKERNAERRARREDELLAPGAGAGARGGPGPAADEADSFTAFFSELRKTANHPLLVRSWFGQPAESSRDGVDRALAPLAAALVRARAFGAQATLDMVLAEVRRLSDWDLHLLCVEHGERQPVLHKMLLPDSALWEGSKAQALRRMLPELIEQGHRVLIFSQWTQILDIVQDMLHNLGIPMVRFDGSTAVDERQDVVDTFNSDASIPCCLLSTRAGGMGINLTSADTVIIHDLDFNPSLDRQAEDRCHRIGQTKKVTVYKMVTQGTVDESILKIQTAKRDLDHMLMHDAATPTNAKGKAAGKAAAKGATDPIKIIMQELLH